MNHRRCLLLCLSLALVACKPDATAEPKAAAPAEAQAPAEPQAPAADAGDAATSASQTPSLKIATLDGMEYDLAAKRGGWVVVNFWATWCAPCIKEMPELSELDARRDDVQVVGLAYEETDAQAMRDFLKTRPVVYPIVLLDVYNPPADFATPRGLPMTYLLNPQGEVAKQFLGPVTAHELETAIAAAGGPAKAS